MNAVMGYKCCWNFSSQLLWILYKHSTNISNNFYGYYIKIFSFVANSPSAVLGPRTLRALRPTVHQTSSSDSDIIFLICSSSGAALERPMHEADDFCCRISCTWALLMRFTRQLTRAPTRQKTRNMTATWDAKMVVTIVIWPWSSWSQTAIPLSGYRMNPTWKNQVPYKKI